MYCIDASVLTNSQIENERFYIDSKNFINKIMENKIKVVVPEIIIPEVASAIARGTGNANYAIKFVLEFRKIPNINIVPVESNLSNLAADIAARHKLRGADSIYVATSIAFNARLITLDKHQKEKASKILYALTPAEELIALQGNN